MLALVGYTRFPIFYSPDGRKILGSNCEDSAFRRYVFGIKDREAVAIRTLKSLNMRRRFVVEGRAINPNLKLAEYVVKKIYVYPSYEPEEAISDAYVAGIVLKGARKPVFVPLILLKYLTEEEALALLGVSKVKDLTVDRMLDFLRRLNIQAETVLDTNVCIETDTQMYLPELVLLIRDRGDVFVYSRRW